MQLQFNNSHCTWTCLSLANICGGMYYIVFFSVVPDDVFAPNYIWKGSYNYRGRKQPMTLSITSFNSTTGRVNVTLSNGNMELLLSGMSHCGYMHYWKSSFYFVIGCTNSLSYCLIEMPFPPHPLHLFLDTIRRGWFHAVSFTLSDQSLKGQILQVILLPTFTKLQWSPAML